METQANKFKLVLMSFDGEYVIDSSHKTKDDAIKTAEDLGSKWVFYPFCFICSGCKVVDAFGSLIRMSDNEPVLRLIFAGRKFKTVQREFKKLFNELERDENENYADMAFFENILSNRLQYRK